MGDGTAVMDPRALPGGGDKVLNCQDKIEHAFVTISSKSQSCFSPEFIQVTSAHGS